MENAAAHPQDFHAALADFIDAASEVRRLAAQLTSFGEAIADAPGESCFVGVIGEQEPLLDQMMSGRRWDAERFPAPSEIQNALRRRLFAREKALKLYSSLTDAARKNAPHVPL